MNYKLKVGSDGKVGYMVSWNVLQFTPLESAEWMLERGKIENKTLKDKPEYPICVMFNGTEYYFEGTWEGEPSIFDDGAKKPRKRMKDKVCE